jgi:uncharacterized protein (UPF0548 family)
VEIESLVNLVGVGKQVFQDEERRRWEWNILRMWGLRRRRWGTM